MSLDICTDCDKIVDTDDFPDYYREEYGHRLICDACWQDSQYDSICPSCSGSGEGQYENTKCLSCGGKGVERR